jgi:vacuolar-type H+-ATPase subunit H
MEDTIRVMELLEDLEDVVEGATKVPMMNKVMIEAEEVNNIIKDIRLSLPDDVQQAKWIRDERDRILAEAKAEYERIIREARKQADYLVEESEITARATKLAQEIKQDAEMQARILKMRTYDYVDKMLYDMQGKMDELNMRYFGEMYSNLEQTFEQINGTLSNNREEIKQLAYKTQSEISGEEEK